MTMRTARCGAARSRIESLRTQPHRLRLAHWNSIVDRQNVSEGCKERSEDGSKETLLIDVLLKRCTITELLLESLGRGAYKTLEKDDGTNKHRANPLRPADVSKDQGKNHADCGRTESEHH